MIDSFKVIPIFLWVLIACLLFSQSIWLFTDARKRNALAWFWGLWGLIQFPTPLIVYMIAVRKIFRRKASRGKTDDMAGKRIP